MNFPKEEMFDQKAKELSKEKEENPRPPRQPSKVNPLLVLLVISGWCLALFFMVQTNLLGIENTRLLILKSKNTQLKDDLKTQRLITADEAKERYWYKKQAFENKKTAEKIAGYLKDCVRKLPELP